MNLRRPEGTPPWRFNHLKTPLLASQEPVKESSRTFIIFHGLGENHSRSLPFQQSQKTYILDQLLVILLPKEYLAENWDTVELTEIMDSVRQKMQLMEFQILQRYRNSVPESSH